MLFYRQSYEESSRRGVCIDHVLTKQGLGVTKGAHGVTKGERVKGRAKKVIVVWKMQTEKVWQDSRGYIYIGKLSGFVRYDGLTLTPFLRGQRENIVGFQEIGGQVRAMGFVRQWSISGDNVTKEPIDPEGNFLLNNFNAADLPTGYVLLEDRQE